MTTLISTLLVAALGVLLATAAAGLAALLAGSRAPQAAAIDGASPRMRGGASVPQALVWGLVAAAALLVLALVLRAIAIGHAPWSNLHEFSIAFAAVLLIAHLLLGRGYPIEGLAPLTALLAAGLVGFALGRDDTVQPLVPALQQPVLLTIHVGTAVLSYAVAGLAFLAALAELAQRHTDDGIGLLPPASVARVVTHRAVLFAFPVLTIAIVLGSVWANLAWRSYWSNDPKEMAAAATWLVFGAYLHVAGRRDALGRLAPWLVVLGFVGVLFTYIGAGLFIVGEHSYGTG
jgi:cytochrome c-type biogenesis protein CcsB